MGFSCQQESRNFLKYGSQANIFVIREPVLSGTLMWISPPVGAQGSFHCTVYFKYAEQVTRKKKTLDFKQRTNCYDLLFMLILTSLHILCYFFCTLNDQLRFQEFQRSNPKHQVRNYSPATISFSSVWQ